MFAILKEATKNFLNSLGEEIKDCKSTASHGIVSMIEINGEIKYKIYLMFFEETLNAISKIYFGEKINSEEEKQDLINEITNQIIGNAKVISNKNFNISIPQYLGEKKIDEIDFDYEINFKFHNRCFHILFKEII